MLNSSCHILYPYTDRVNIIVYNKGMERINIIW